MQHIAGDDCLFACRGNPNTYVPGAHGRVRAPGRSPGSGGDWFQRSSRGPRRLSGRRTLRDGARRDSRRLRAASSNGHIPCVPAGSAHLEGRDPLATDELRIPATLIEVQMRCSASTVSHYGVMPMACRSSRNLDRRLEKKSIFSLAVGANAGVDDDTVAVGFHGKSLEIDQQFTGRGGVVRLQPRVCQHHSSGTALEKHRERVLTIPHLDYAGDFNFALMRQV